ncbi:Afadin and alpha-actinin-binding-domain-containing protein [Lentinula detonsa]|uniref:Afadin and alpha-actinin-binding-domain-containing protein n=1 Tax=Lentinula detonsa TaxID=2804962 RepID=A0A9W8P342_9AGAR|nr:Afadin and alpha-actinin-binding-domain-containing protein [Lentinula detonsa]
MAATATPARTTVHWSSETSEYSDLRSPLSQAQISDDSFVSTSSLEYINSQLVSHGFSSAPGVCLDGLSKGDMDKTVKCFLDMLAQRMKDMSRTERLTAELRTLRYDHERMISMHRTASESAANFEREVNLQKSRLGTTTKTLQATETAHKNTNAELHRTRSALQTVRATHQAEVKKKEKEMERVMERWARLADSQAKLGAAASGLRFCGRSVNGAVEPGVQIFGKGKGKGKGLLEVALEEAEKAREQLGKDNLGLRKMLLKAVNEIQTISFELRQSLLKPAHVTEAPTPMTLPELFPLSPPNFTPTTLSSSLARLRDVLEMLSSPTDSMRTFSSISPVPRLATSQPEIERLNQVIEQLKSDLRRSKEQVNTNAVEAQAITHPTQDEERERVVVLERELEEERQRITEAMVQLENDRFEIEAERARLHQEEKRRSRAETETMFAKVTPAEDDLEARLNDDVKRGSTSTYKPKTSPRKPQSPSKMFQINIGKAHRRTMRVGTARRRSSSSSVSISPSKSSRKDAEPSFETEVIPRLPPSISIVDVSAPVLSTSSSTESLLPTAFVLPPPSPSASLPLPKPALLLSGASALPPISFHHTLRGPSGNSKTLSEPSENSKTLSEPSLQVYVPTSVTPLEEVVKPVPLTPTPLAEARRAFPYPVAKPLATHMVHAYSPVRPSPLSRILLLGNSPESSSSSLNISPEDDSDSDSDSDSRGLVEGLVEEEEEREVENDDGLLVAELFPPISHSRASSSDDEGGLTLAQQLGISDSPPERPVFTRPESSSSMTNKAQVRSKPAFGGFESSRSSWTVDRGAGMKAKANKSKSVGPPSLITKTKMKTKIKIKTKSTTRTGTGINERSDPSNTGGNEKENSCSSGSAVLNLKDADGEKLGGVNAKSGLPNVDVRSRLRGISAPRRVPIDSADAAPIGRRRK